MSRSILRLKKYNIKILIIILLFALLTPLVFFVLFNINYQQKIFPNVYVAGVNLGGLTTSEASEVLAKELTLPPSIKLNESGQILNLDTKEIDLRYDYQSSANDAFNLTRSGNIQNDLVKRTELLINPVHLKLSVSLDNDKLQKFLSVLSGQISQDPVNPSVKLVNGKASINKGSPGFEVDQAMLTSLIVDSLSSSKEEVVFVPVNALDPSLSDSEVETLKQSVEKFVGKKLQINFEFQTFTLSDDDIVKLINPKGGWDDQELSKAIDKISGQVNRDPQNPKFNFDGGKVTEFQPATDGIKVKGNDFKSLFTLKLTQLSNSSDKIITMDIPVDRTSPEVSTDKVNNLGIKELIGRGTSTYFHSIPGRVHNVVLAASRINGTLVKPGDTFSFNNTLGDVSQFTGYQQAYIIQNGKTILGDGGGVCQVSTTLFRALLNAGLPINERTAHAYRVGYYEQNSPPGLDATVYGPTPDLKFTNDTPGYVLIEATANPKNYSLVFELYGTSDGRVATITKPIVTNVTPPPDDLYQDDPTLPTGTVKQVDFKAWGAKVTFNYSVVRGGEQIYKKTYVSNYRPWQAVYLRGTGPAI